MEAESAKDKKIRRDFYTNFTEKALARTGGEYDEEKTAVVEGVVYVEHEQDRRWRSWVDLRHRVPDASARLFCCPWAGGNSLAFERWPEQLPGVEVVPLLLPGRLTRVGESPVDNLSQIVEMAVEALRGLHLLRHDDIPCFMFGHEFGALVAFEICRSVEEEFPMKALFVSSMSCPQMVHEREKITLLCQVSPRGEILHAKNAEFENAILRRGPPMPPELSENRDLLAIFTPLWFADLSAMDTFEYKSGALLECPIYSLEGDKDDQQKMGSWAMESSSSKSDTIRFPGGSFFFLRQEHEAEILRLIGDCCCKNEPGEGAVPGATDGDDADMEAREDTEDSESSG